MVKVKAFLTLYVVSIIATCCTVGNGFAQDGTIACCIIYYDDDENAFGRAAQT